MNKQILYDKDLSEQERFLYVLMDSFLWEVDVQQLAEIMGIRKSSIFKLIDELVRHEIIQPVKYSLKTTVFLTIVPFKKQEQDFPELNIKEMLAFQRKPIPPSGLNEVHEFFYQNKKDPQSAIDFWNYYEAVGWYAGNQPITNWRAKALSWSSGFKPKPEQPKNNEHPGKKRGFWERKWD